MDDAWDVADRAGAGVGVCAGVGRDKSLELLSRAQDVWSDGTFRIT